jgi:hypothetical protein
MIRMRSSSAVLAGLAWGLGLNALGLWLALNGGAVLWLLVLAPWSVPGLLLATWGVARGSISTDSN